MKTLVVVASLMLTVIMFAVGHIVGFMSSFLAITFNLPGPYSESPEAWIWFVLSLLVLFGVSYAFCGWLTRNVQKKLSVSKIFE
jgi:hypothetical protein